MATTIVLLARRLLDIGWLRTGLLALVLAAVLPGSGLAPRAPWAPLARPPGLGLPPAAAPRIRLEVQGRPRWVPLGTTLDDVVRDLRLRPAAGSLLAMDGTTLRHGVYPGRVLLDGQAASGSTPLGAGARITLRPGRSRVEPLNRLVLEFAASGPRDPQLSLATGAGRQVLTSGALSHQARVSAFEPRGPQRVPNAVALTFDDGPWPDSTPEILGILERERVPATFFLVGQQVRRYPGLLRREVDAGMTIGTHSFSHPQPFGRLSRAAMRQEIAGGLAALADNGVRTLLFRPPGGAIAPGVLASARREGLRTVLWTVDPSDWHRGSRPDQIVRRVLTAAKPGSIVLLHDGGGDRAATVAALPRIIKGLKQRKLVFVTL
ncbi:MAG TPA: polysaccharide deacetylase family protein [Actinomycetes bacterium]|nr:polysaccharide deacetylase family protein [Actinomycetes bacterium]